MLRSLMQQNIEIGPLVEIQHPDVVLVGFVPEWYDADQELRAIDLYCRGEIEMGGVWQGSILFI